MIFGLADSIGARLQLHGFPSDIILMVPYITKVAILSISMIRKYFIENKTKSSLIKIDNK